MTKILLMILSATILSSSMARAQTPSAPPEFPDLDSRLAEITKERERVLSFSIPAPVNHETFLALVDRLATDGTRSPGRGRNELLSLTRERPLNKGETIHIIGMSVVENFPEETEAGSQPRFSDLVYRRYFGQVNAQSQDIVIDPKTKIGTVDKWDFRLSPDGTLREVIKMSIPVRWVAEGRYLILRGVVERQMAPADPAVLARWEALAAELKLLTRTYRA